MQAFTVGSFVVQSSAFLNCLGRIVSDDLVMLSRASLAATRGSNRHQLLLLLVQLQLPLARVNIGNFTGDAPVVRCIAP